MTYHDEIGFVLHVLGWAFLALGMFCWVGAIFGGRDR